MWVGLVYKVSTVSHSYERHLPSHLGKGVMTMETDLVDEGHRPETPEGLRESFQEYLASRPSERVRLVYCAEPGTDGPSGLRPSLDGPRRPVQDP